MYPMSGCPWCQLRLLYPIMLVGAVPDARFRACTVDLAPGDSCVLYSDGVTEAHGGLDGRQVFGEERLAAVLAGCDVLPATPRRCASGAFARR